jgi:Sulfotransferase domain
MQAAGIFRSDLKAMEITSESLAGTAHEPATAYKHKPTASLSGVSAVNTPNSRSRFRLRNSGWTRRNFSSRARELSGGEAIILSVPKSGRTWLRAFLCAYFCKRFGLEFTLRPDRYDEHRIPRLVFSHDLFEHRTKGDGWDRLRGKYLIPRRELDRAKIILLTRDPRDCFVSLYLQLTRRDPNAPLRLRQKTVSEMLCDRRFGVHAIINAMNDWINEFSGRDNFSLVRYEALRASPAECFRDLLAVLGEASTDPNIFQEALEFSRFENMQKLEAAGAFDSNILHPGDVRDPESFKVRRGKVGGYREYLSVEDQQYAATALAELDPRFGYTF